MPAQQWHAPFLHQSGSHPLCTRACSKQKIALTTRRPNRVPGRRPGAYPSHFCPASNCQENWQPRQARNTIAAATTCGRAARGKEERSHRIGSAPSCRQAAAAQPPMAAEASRTAWLTRAWMPSSTVPGRIRGDEGKPVQARSRLEVECRQGSGAPVSHHLRAPGG